MKELVNIIVFSLIGCIAAHSQTQYETGMKNAFDLWDNGQSMEAANLFERIGQAEPDAWLPYYYASEIKITGSFDMEDAVKKEQQLKEAQELLNKAKALAEPENVELMVLQAMLHTGYITLDPSTYGMKLSPVITGIYDTAAAKAPENPRVALSRTEWNMGSARFFGEDPAKYCPDLQKALLLFEQEEPEQPFAPDWGKSRTEMLITQTCGEYKKD